MLLRRPHPLVLSITLLFLGATLLLANWQYQKGKARMRSGEAYQHVLNDKPLPLNMELARAEVWRAYVVTGHWLQSGAILLDNQMHGELPGYLAIAPFQLANGKVVLVKRGWIPRDLPATAIPQPATGLQTITLRVVPFKFRYLALSNEQIAGQVWQNLDRVAYERMIGHSLDACAEQLDSDRVLTRDWMPPDDGAFKNFSYAGQWLLFAVVALILFVRSHWKQKDGTDR
ncbi:SURF1 family protein [Burkholderiaceae bacterium DAT-1]|nr:SURF1 family protein [Burkholderiaceae bacterium DAT-1]